MNQEGLEIEVSTAKFYATFYFEAIYRIFAHRFISLNILFGTLHLIDFMLIKVAIIYSS